MEVKWFQDEKGSGYIEYKKNGEIVIYLYDSSKVESTTNVEIIKLNFIQSKSGYIVKEN